MKTPAVALLFLAVAACGPSNDPIATASTGPVARQPAGRVQDPASPAASPASAAANAPKDLPGRLKCLRQSGGVLVIGPRGGSTRGYPANALKALDRTLRAGTRADEIDIAQSREGKLFLMQDDDLDRRTTGKGPVPDQTWEGLAKLNL